MFCLSGQAGTRGISSSVYCSLGISLTLAPQESRGTTGILGVLVLPLPFALAEHLPSGLEPRLASALPTRSRRARSRTSLAACGSGGEADVGLGPSGQPG